MADTRAVLLVRATLLTLPAVGTASLAHLYVDGCVEVGALLLAVAATWTSAAAVVSGRRSTGLLLAWILGAQVATHLLLAAQCDGIAHALAVPGAGMIGVHLLTAALVAPVLARREAGLATARRIVTRWQRTSPAAHPRPWQPALAAGSTPRPTSRTVHDASRRGPPRGL